MREINVITGLPRSGSTLLCNILNQNPDFYASSTSPLPEIMGLLVNKFSTSAEVQAALIKDSHGTTARLNGMLTAVIEQWYGNVGDKVVFDKSRGWSFNALLLAELFPEARIILTVRDLRSVFGSVEKQHRKTPALDPAPNALQKTLFARADAMLGPDGLIGQSAVGSEDIIRRFGNQVFVLHYEAFTLDPDTKLREIYNFLGYDYFPHDFQNIANTSEDVDALYLNKFPHEGSGKVTPTDRREWQEFVPADVGRLIYQRYPAYNQFFGYQ